MNLSCEIPRWQQLKKLLVNLEPADFLKQLEADEDAILIDVRTDLEYQSGTLQDAMHLDYFSDSLLERLEVMDKTKSYYLICRTGRRSIRTGVLMKNWGFDNVINLEGGLTALQELELSDQRYE